ncbi:MAG: uroporphyrinogen decarboxylase family protein [Anaerolineae bacterium]
MNDRERYIAHLQGKPTDRAPFLLYWGPWARTWDRWRHQGMPAHFHDFADVRAAFGADAVPHALPVNTGPCPEIPSTVLEEDENYVVFIDGWGIKRRDYKHGESMSAFLEFPVKGREDWEAFKATYLDPDHPNRLSGNWRELGQAWGAKNFPIRLGAYPNAGIFGPYRWLMGDEEGLVALYTMPDLAHEIMNHLTTLYLTVFEKVVAEVRVDEIHLWEDMCYRNGPLISPAHWEAFLGPCYHRIKAFADAHEIPLVSVDTDGNPDLIAPNMIEAGVNLLFPMEVAAGCDVTIWRRKYPTLGMLGGIDKRALAEGPHAIDAELARIQPALAAGRYIPALDHLVPDDVSWENYAYYVRALRTMISRPSKDPSPPASTL